MTEQHDDHNEVPAIMEPVSIAIDLLKQAHEIDGNTEDNLNVLSWCEDALHYISRRISLIDESINTPLQLTALNNS